jgi:hypothetical protein
MPFTPGNQYGGRNQGSVNRRSNELRRRLKERGDIDPADYCSQIVSNTNESTELRLQAANYLLPYLYPKRGPVPTPLYLDEPIVLPHPDPKTISQSNANILYLSNLKAQGRIDRDWGDNLIVDQCRVRDGLIDDAKLIQAGSDHADQTIRIEGGLPTLPGTNINMPVINGHTIGAILGPVTDSDATNSTETPGP